jgi:histone acetyltransferase MYST1
MCHLFNKMADGGLSDKENVGEKGENALDKQDRRSEHCQAESKMGGDNEDADSLEEQPLDIGEHYLVRRSDGSWRKLRLHVCFANSR